MKNNRMNGSRPAFAERATSVADTAAARIAPLAQILLAPVAVKCVAEYPTRVRDRRSFAADLAGQQLASM
jgi:hypothetical protein